MADKRFFGESERSVFDEEQVFLDEVESRIDSMVDVRRRKIGDLDGRLAGWHAVDYDDVDFRRSLGRDRARKADEIDNLLSYKPDPYFCRFEVSTENGQSKSYCVGERPLADLGDIVVLDWRSPLGHTYANKTQRQFRVVSPESGQEHVYNLHLRRLVDIKDARIVEVSTEYDDAAAISLDGEIVDPFLLSVLRDKRRNFRLSGIIKTIQATQNSILERPVNESFIVQGCAGSGKTMILLHRLSYLAFNHPEVDFSRYIVLTPSESFNAHIDDLCDQLDLDRVKRLTVESFYARLATQLSRIDTYYEIDSKGRKGKAVPKISASTDGLVSESCLGDDFLRYVYSLEFLEDISDRFMAITDAAYEKLESAGISELFASRGYEPLDTESAPYDVFRGLTVRCERMRRDASAAEKFVADKKEAYETAVAECERARVSYQSAVDALDPFLEQVAANHLDHWVSHCQRLDTMRLARAKLVEMLEDAGKRRDILVEENARLEVELSAAQAQLSSAEVGALAASETSLEDNPEIARRVEEACRAEAARLAQLKRDYDKASVFNLGKRRRIREELDSATAEYERARGAAFEQIVEESTREAEAERTARIERCAASVAAVRENLDGVRARLSEASSQFAELTARMDELAPAQEALETYARAVGPFVAEFEKTRYPLFSKAVNVEEIRRFAPEIAGYIDAYRLLAASQKRSLESGEAHIDALERRSTHAREDYLEAQGGLMSPAEEAMLLQAEGLCRGLDVRSFADVVDGLLADFAQRSGTVFAHEARYRHRLYVQAALCLFYYGPPADGGACICIDEAQDLSPAEHSLIKSSLGPNAVVNLYGDLNQLVYDYKGVSNWDELDDEGGMSRYVLRENYRNTVQVTDFCNNELGMDIAGVGLAGPEVETSSLGEAVAKLVALHEEHEGMRCAIIYAEDAKERIEREKCLAGPSIEWGVVSSEAVAVISVGASKGLEFDAVVVIDCDMTRNEKYVACTRSIELLIVAEVEPWVENIGSENGDGGSMVSAKTPVGSRIETEVDLRPESPMMVAPASDLSEPTFAYRANTKCVRHGGKVVGAPYAGALPVSGDAPRYMCAECCPAGAMHVVEGDCDGRIIGEADFEWSNPEGLAQIDTDRIKRTVCGG